MEAPLLEVKNLKLHFPLYEGAVFQKQVGAVRAVDGISFEVRKGETLGVVGESGCGKSSSIRAVAMLHRPTAGEVFFEGVDITKLSKKKSDESSQEYPDGLSGSLRLPKPTHDCRQYYL